MSNTQRTFVTGLALFITSAGQSPDTLWTRTYGGSLNDVAYGACPAFDSGYVIVGLTESGSSGPQDAYLVCINESGDTIWTRRYGGASYEAFHSIKQTTDGNYIAAGYTSSFGAGNKDIWLAKLNPDGDTIWTRTYGRNLNDCAYTVCETGDQGFVFTGYVDGPSGWIKGNLWVVKIDPDGDTIWTRCYGGSSEDLGITIDTTAGGYIIAGNTMSFGAGGKDAWLLRTNANGDTLWTRTYGLSQEDVGYGVCRTPDGGFIMTGYINGTGAWTPGDLWIIRTDGQGDTLWSRIFGTAGADDSWSIIPAPAGGYICGARKGTNNGDLWVVRMSESGDTLWTMNRGGMNLDAGLGIVVTPDGGFLCAGYTLSTGAGNADFYVVKLEAETGIHEGSSSRHLDITGQTFFARSLGQVFRPGMYVYDATGSVISIREPGSGVYFYRVGNVIGRLVIVR